MQELLVHYTYWILIPLAMVEGPVLAIIAGFLISTGVLQPVPTYFLFLLSDILPDIGYYALGRWGRRSRMFHWLERRFPPMQKHRERLERLWQKHGWKAMTFSKLAYGLGAALLASAGLAHLSFSKFLQYAIPVTVLQYVILLALGYMAGSSYTRLTATFDSISVLIPAIITVLILGYFAVAFFMRRALLKEDQNLLP